MKHVLLILLWILLPFSCNAAETSPEVVRAVAPCYPDRAKHERAEGKAKILLRLALDGSVLETDRVAGLEPFTKVSEHAARQWLFAPAKEDRWVVITFTFDLLGAAGTEDTAPEPYTVFYFPNNVLIREAMPEPVGPGDTYYEKYATPETKQALDLLYEELEDIRSRKVIHTSGGGVVVAAPNAALTLITPHRVLDLVVPVAVNEGGQVSTHAGTKGVDSVNYDFRKILEYWHLSSALSSRDQEIKYRFVRVGPETPDEGRETIYIAPTSLEIQGGMREARAPKPATQEPHTPN